MNELMTKVGIELIGQLKNIQTYKQIMIQTPKIVFPLYFLSIDFGFVARGEEKEVNAGTEPPPPNFSPQKTPRS